MQGMRQSSPENAQAMLPGALSVSQLNRLVSDSLKTVGERGRVTVVGEISSWKYLPAYNMVVFTLCEGKEVLDCVVFSNFIPRLRMRDMLTGEVFPKPRPLEEIFKVGSMAAVMGDITTSTKKISAYRLAAFSVSPVGAGDREARLRALQENLTRLGYFADERKRPLPPNPTRVALVTSLSGAVIHDFLRNAQDRGLGVRMRLYPSSVQGDAAGAELAQAVTLAGHDGWSQVVVVMRGGGSKEDLACFNDEALARAIFECPVPVVAGIGHEVDFSFADMTADVRASTPTKAAQILWTPRDQFRQELGQLKNRLDRAAERLLASAGARLDGLEKLARARSPEARLQRLQARTDELTRRLRTFAGLLVQGYRERSAGLQDRSRKAFARLAERGAMGLQQTGAHLARAGLGLVDSRRNLLERLSLQLETVSPMAPLEKGFALLQDEDGHVLRSVRDLAPGQIISARVKDGTAIAQVTAVRPDGQEGA